MPEEREEIPDDVEIGLVAHTATLNNHNERVRFWTQRLVNLFTCSNKHWLLDQFKYCKWFLLKNAFYIEKSELPKAKTPRAVIMARMAPEPVSRTLSNVYESDSDGDAEEPSEEGEIPEESKEGLVHQATKVLPATRVYPATIRNQISNPIEDEEANEEEDEDEKVRVINILALLDNFILFETFMRDEVRVCVFDHKKIRKHLKNKNTKDNMLFILGLTTCSLNRNYDAIKEE